MIELLGGHWGKTGLEKRYADAERALFQCSQQADESHDSYLARADVLWSKLKAQKLQVNDLQAYITLRGAQLTSEDKKRIILDSDSSLEGSLTIGRVREAVRMLGTSFFQEMTGLGKKVSKAKVYDSLTMFTEEHDHHGDADESANVANHDDWTEDDLLEALIAEGDDDAVFIADFETAASELVQGDEDLAAAYSTYMEARRKLSEKYRSRGFWPISKGKAKGRGKSKGRAPWGNRKSLQQRIMESNCRLCGKKGHWRNECPMKGQSTSTSASAAVTATFAAPGTTDDEAMPAEFLSLPEVAEPRAKDILSNVSCFVQTVFSSNGCRPHPSSVQPKPNLSSLRDKIRNHIKGNKGTNFGVKSLVARIEQKLRQHSKPSSMPSTEACRPKRILRPDQVRDSAIQVSKPMSCSKETDQSMPAPVESPMTATASTEADMFFATHDTWGIVDTGATKTVMGSSHVKEFLENLHPQVKPHVRRSSSNVVFRFGNQGTLKAMHALVVPVCGMWLKISVVAGSTPFLISNTLLRALGAMIDTNNHQLILKNHNTNIQLQLSPKGLYLMNMNDLFTISPVPGSHEVAAETYAQDDHSSGQKNAICPTSNSREVPMPTTAKGYDTPVINRSDSANPNVHRILSQETDACQQPLHPIRSHGQLCPEIGPCSSQLASSRTGVHRAPDKGEPQGRSDELRQEPFGQNVRGNVGLSPRLDQMVHSTLSQQHQTGAPEDDSLYWPQDRRDRSQRGPSLADASGQSQGQESSQVIGGQAKDDARAQYSDSVESRDRHRDLRDDERITMGERNTDARGDPEHPGADDRAGDSHATDDCPDVSGADDAAAPGALNDARNCHRRMGGPMEPVNEEDSSGDWALRAGEIDQFCSSLPNVHHAKFWKIVEKIELELAQTAKIIKPNSTSIDLLEVFCSSESMLTAQTIQQGGTAKRFGYDQGDLMQTEGRRDLFASVIRYRPKHIWMSPTCGPWSKWSAFNSQRSIQAWDQTQQDRIQMLTQIALCLVLSRHQHRCQRHAHWEQPKGSLMMKIPPVQEVHRYMVVAKPDLCRAGNLQDPQNKMPIKKGLEIHTTSLKLYNALDPLKCNRSHEHQVIEGSTVSQGMTVSRSQFSELYPRKFARLVAKTLLKQRFPIEKPVGNIADPALICFDAITADVNASAAKERPAKRIRKSPVKGTKVPAATGALEQPGETKRQRLNPPEVSTEQHETTVISTDQQKAEAILKRIEAILPRVGKKRIDSPAILQDLHHVFPGFKIVQLIAGKGTDRLFEPPREITPEEAPYRRSIMRLRQNQKVIFDDSWEKYDKLSKRQLIRKSPACRVNITMFAAKEIESQPRPLIESPARPIQDADSVPGSSEVTPPVSTPSMNPRNADSLENQSIQHEETPFETKMEQAEKPGTSTDEQPDADHLQPEAKTGHGPRFRALPKEEQALIKRAHQNLCHPSPEQLSAVLRTQGCRPEVSQAVFDMECSTCISCQRPKISRPSSLKDSLDFNDKVFIDGISWTAKNGVMYHFYHLLDQATNYHVAIPAPSRSADQAINKVSDAWFLWAGPPNALIMDAATEFTSEDFGNFLQRHEVRGITTSPHAHWQNGRCERHGQILQNMLNKLDHESPITTFKEFQQALIQCTHAKNTLSIRAGFAPEVLVFGKSSKLPGSVVSSEDVSAHASANRDDAQGIAFRQNLALRERARVAFHRADNDMALRRACLRRTRPDRQGYDVGEWVMMWQPQKENNGYWFGPLKIVQQEKNLSVWATAGGKLHRRAPEHVRPVSSAEARRLPEVGVGTVPNPVSNHPQAIQIPQISPESNPEGPLNNINNPPISEDNTSQSQDQPDNEPEGVNSDENPNDNEPMMEQPSTIHIDTPIPEDEGDDALVTSHLLCCDDEINVLDPMTEPCAWRCEFEVPHHCVGKITKETSADEILLATTEKKQRTEVKLSLLAPDEKAAFQAAKQTEVQNWLTTGTVSKILRSKLAPEQILRCRWLLVWKEKDSTQKSETKEHHGLSKLQTHKAKARLVVLGYLDPNLTEVPRDSPTLGRQSKMMLLQVIASKGWSLGIRYPCSFLAGPNSERQNHGN